jgi:hypothetical protein
MKNKNLPRLEPDFLSRKFPFNVRQVFNKPTDTISGRTIKDKFMTVSVPD